MKLYAVSNKTLPKHNKMYAKVFEGPVKRLEAVSVDSACGTLDWRKQQQGNYWADVPIAFLVVNTLT